MCREGADPTVIYLSRKRIHVMIIDCINIKDQLPKRLSMKAQPIKTPTEECEGEEQHIKERSD